MKAVDVMVRDLVTVGPDASVTEAARLMSENDVSALPVLDKDGRLVGIVSEADLLRRKELGTDTRRPWWIEAMTPATALAAEFAKSHGKRVAEVMSENVITAAEETPLAEIATLLERNRIKRIPITRDGELVGIVSRANLVQALASSALPPGKGPDQSRAIREELLSQLADQTWTDFGSRNVIVNDGTVHLWGLVGSEAERKALLAIAEGVSGVTTVVDEMIPAISLVSVAKCVNLTESVMELTANPRPLSAGRERSSAGLVSGPFAGGPIDRCKAAGGLSVNLRSAARSVRPCL
jgi:CBS domain-containing protein